MPEWVVDLGPLHDNLLAIGDCCTTVSQPTFVSVSEARWNRPRYRTTRRNQRVWEVSNRPAARASHETKDSGSRFALAPLSDTLANDHDPIPFCLQIHSREFVSHSFAGFFERGSNPEPTTQERARPIHGAAAGVPGRAGELPSSAAGRTGRDQGRRTLRRLRLPP